MRMHGDCNPPRKVAFAWPLETLVEDLGVRHFTRRRRQRCCAETDPDPECARRSAFLEAVESWRRVIWKILRTD